MTNEENTNEKKARKIVEYYETRYNDTRDLQWYDLEDIALQAMQWKDEEHAKQKQQWITKVCKWLKEHYGIFASTIPFWWSDFLDMLKQDLEEEL